MDELDEVVQEFLVESFESLDALDTELVDLEEDPSKERIAGIFRTVHTIKGTSGFLGFEKLEAITHIGENLLSRLRDGQLDVTPEITTALLQTIDAVRGILENVKATETEGDGDYSALIARLEKLHAGKKEPDAQAAPKATPTVTSTQIETGAAVEHVSQAHPDTAKVTPSADTQPKQATAASNPKANSGAKPTAKKESADTSESSIRVDVGLLDRLMNLVGELVLARNQVLQLTSRTDDPTFVQTSSRLNLLTTELQEGIMKTRMQPIGSVWGKFPRVVRDLALACGKKVALEMEGKETELDRSLIEAIKGPLTHIVRNSVDHGIEPPEVRKAAGKPDTGVLKLRAFHESGKVNIQITDDGKGLDPETILAKGIERGLVSADHAADMSEREIFDLIFAPGFSTAKQVTNVSGRGVGMDVVRTSIEKVGGSVDMHSEPGKGTTLSLKIPLTLAIIPALVVTTSGERFAIPQLNLMELVRLEGETGRARIESIHGAPVYRLRGRLLPLVYLNEVLGLPASNASQDEVSIVVLEAEGQQFGLVADSINDTEEIVVKPLGSELKELSVYAGATIMGDGHVALILDVLGLAARSQVLCQQNRERARRESQRGEAKSAGHKRSLLLLGTPAGGQVAIPLDVVARLEELPASDIERASGGEVIQYRGEILPLVRLSQVIDSTATARDARELTTPDHVKVVVYSGGNEPVGLVVDEILDIVDQDIEHTRNVSSEGIRSQAVVQGRVTDLLDIRSIIAARTPQGNATLSIQETAR